MRYRLRKIAAVMAAAVAGYAFAPQGAKAQSLFDETYADGEPLDLGGDYGGGDASGPSRPRAPLPVGAWALPVDTNLIVEDLLLPPTAFMPAIFDTYSLKAPEEAFNPLEERYNDKWDATTWADRAVARDSRVRAFVQEYMIAHPELVRYNQATLPRPPKEFKMTVDPEQAKIHVTEFERDRKQMLTLVGEAPPVRKIHWLNNIDDSLQFSQAYISPNWYQGGKSNLNMIANVVYNVKLNPAYHKNLIFETYFAYKFGMNNAPEDEVHDYNISEDLLQINTKFGYKAAKRWYYSLTAQFKTQLWNNYKVNSDVMTASFMSPGDLTVGLGMTYAYENPRKTLQFNASIAPLSYNLKTCLNDKKLNPKSFGIDEGRRTKSEYGSSSELTLRWKLAYNIEYFSRLFVFTDYEQLTGDWENTITFNINKFLSTRIFAHLRYQSLKAPEVEGWRHWQLKEILSIGFSYKFNRS